MVQLLSLTVAIFLGPGLQTQTPAQVPYLHNAETRRLVSGCVLPVAKAGAPSFRVIVTVDAQGKLAGANVLGAGSQETSMKSLKTLQQCHFAPHQSGGKAMDYHGEIVLPK